MYPTIVLDAIADRCVPLPDELLIKVDKLRRIGCDFALFAAAQGRFEKSGWFFLHGKAQCKALSATQDYKNNDKIRILALEFEWLSAQCHSNYGIEVDASQAVGLEYVFEFCEFYADRGAASTAQDRLHATRKPDAIEIPAMPDDYREAIDQIQRWIRQGDLYQLNLTRRFSLAFSAAELVSHWCHQVQILQPPFACLLHTQSQTLACLSPEEWISSDGEDIVTAPIKGTALQTDTELQSAKNRAEHTMIVDLERNDLARICEKELVQTPYFQQAVQFGGISHLVSLVRGQLARGIDWQDILGVMGPSGSISGAPKLAVLDHINKVESFARSYYCGALALQTAHFFTSALPIRTAIANNRCTYAYSGGGIVIDSDPLQEWQEIWRKLYWVPFDKVVYDG